MQSHTCYQGPNLRQAWPNLVKIPYKVTHYSKQDSYHLETLDGRRLPLPWNIEHLKQYH